MSILGRKIELEGSRIVFLGTDEKRPSTYFVGFKNEAGKDTLLCLSKEAMEALHHLFRNDDVGLPLEPYPFDSALSWQAVKRP